jgi:hypothetical protein
MPIETMGTKTKLVFKSTLNATIYWSSLKFDMDCSPFRDVHTYKLEVSLKLLDGSPTHICHFNLIRLTEFEDEVTRFYQYLINRNPGYLSLIKTRVSNAYKAM